jgi:putative pyruvate formate lyase activating enzyme
MDDFYNISDRKLLSNCSLCPHECYINRFTGADGYCHSNAGFNISSICIHRGEEPVIGGEAGICNIFFSGCNLRCIYCQNFEISRLCSGENKSVVRLIDVLDRIEKILTPGIKSVGFVSPSHMVPQVKAIIAGLKSRGLYPVIVYNTNSYDKIESLRSLSGLVDVYLPDFKYVSPELSGRYSEASDYPGVALKAIKEMYYQKGSTLITDESGVAENGILLRHLVLPGHIEESIKVLRTIANEISTGIHLSLMSQYHPVKSLTVNPDLSRTLYKEEYDSVVEEMYRLGFRNGYVQDLDSFQSYLPDFSRKDPFEE